MDISIFKSISNSIIDKLSNIENYIKSVWEMPRSPIYENYVITLDRISDIGIIQQIINHPNIELQIQEWQDLGIIDNMFTIDDIIIDGMLTNEYKHLPIDTKYFKDLEYEILSLFDDLDNSLDGWLIKSENYQALNTILPKFKEKVQTIYIDPPFNTGDDFDYVDHFQDSSWLTLMENRLAKSLSFLKKIGNYLLHLDENANAFGKILIKDIFKQNVSNEIIWDKGFRGTEAKDIFQHAHDTIFFIKRSNCSVWNQPTQMYRDQNLERYNKVDEDGKHYALIKRTRNDGTVYYGKTYPKEEGKAANDVISYIPTMASTNKQRWNDFKTQKPEELLQVLIEATSNPGDLIFDFFSGSGTTLTTAHKSKRKWIGVEMGEHFYSVILPRMKEVLAGYGIHEPCGISKDTNWQGGGFFKYYELEQYEDTLRNVKYDDYDLFNNPYQDIYNQYVFMRDLKMLEALEIDYENNKANVDLSKLYKNIDIPETLSNLTGKWIKKITSDYVEFEDGEKIDIKNLDYKLIKSLIYHKIQKRDNI